MSKKAFMGVKAGLEDAIAYAKGDKRRGRVTRVKVKPIDVKAARKKLGLSQDKFAATFGISAATLRKWEQGQRVPRGSARVLLQVIAREPQAVKRALS